MPTRRELLVAAGSSALSQTKVAGANDRLRFGVIGAGARGAFHARRLAVRSDAEVVSVCDVYQTRAEAARQQAKVKEDVAKDYRRVLDRKDIDAVVVSVSDHWHTPILLDALDSGKDVFLEKPMTWRIEEGHDIVKSVKRTGRVVQVGTQQKSGPHFLEAKQRFFDSGLIGKVSLIRTFWIANRGFFRHPPKGFAFRPDELDWKLFQGRAPKRPFDAQRYFGWTMFQDYSTGQPGGVFTHLVDTAHMMLGLAAPSAVVALGGNFEFSEDRDTPDTISLLAEYPQKVTLTADATQSSPRDIVDVEFHGSGGVLNIFRNGYKFRPNDSGAPVIEARGVDADGPHMDNFIQAARSRKQPNADVVYSHYVTAICHMGNLSYFGRRRVDWDPAWNVETLSK
ncbi:MAG: Gfo/Idh/MocA family oxidoreductase [Bryobacterales bacterium]|nr:Gfo/Idh/MocA family oxidoreductase [Bryobacterales bacterium]